MFVCYPMVKINVNRLNRNVTKSNHWFTENYLCVKAILQKAIASTFDFEDVDNFSSLDLYYLNYNLTDEFTFK